jgi:mannose-1-phosphate guanylyltransferase
MKLVLLSGGSGKRLWPLSNDSRSKQFLTLLQGPSGSLESMVQRVWRQIGSAGYESDACIATGKGQLDLIRNQLGAAVPVILEPERRDTFPAIALAAAYLYSIQGVSLNETVVVLPVDSFVEDRFFTALEQLDSAIQQSGAELALMGVKPSYPSEKFGYIVTDSVSNPLTNRETNGYLPIEYFVEKPPERQAELLLSMGALWNCGVFAFRLNTMIDLFIEQGLPIQYDEMVKQYSQLNRTSFDYEVVERVKHAVVVPYDGEWKDLGTWNTLTEEMKAPIIGTGTVCAESHNTHLINELNIPIAVLGLSNVIVTASPDGILVADKKASTKLKEAIACFEQRPMYEERRWGYYRVLEYKKFSEGHEVLTKRICIKAGRNLSYQQHTKRKESWTVISGEGELVLNGRLIRIRTGDVIQIPVGAAHGLKANLDLEIIEVQFGTELVEEDIIRLTHSWDETIASVTDPQLL